MQDTPLLSFYFSCSLLGDLRANKITPNIAATTFKIIANTIPAMAPPLRDLLLLFPSFEPPDEVPTLDLGARLLEGGGRVYGGEGGARPLVKLLPLYLQRKFKLLLVH